MACYLCMSLLSGSPTSAQPSPGTSPTVAQDPVGTCNKCNVWACSRHGTRYSWFECAMCTPAIAAKSAITGTGGGQPALARAQWVGSRAHPAIRQAAGVALERLVADHRQQADQRQQARLATFTAPGGSPNLITDLSQAIRGAIAQQAERTLTELPPRADPSASYEAIGAAVREQLAGQPVLPATDFSATVLAGALVMAYRLADDTTRQPARSDGTRGLPPPWQVSHPALLDPILWMVGTAYHLGSAGQPEQAR
jgi:hypothetical protein